MIKAVNWVLFEQIKMHRKLVVSYLIIVSLVFSLSLEVQPVLAELEYSAEYSVNQIGPLNNEAQNFMFDENGPRFNIVDETVTTPNSSYTFNVLSLPDNPFELKAHAQFDMSINGRNAPFGWASTEVSATAKSTLLDSAFVEGVPGGTAGSVEFMWIVTGLSQISLESKLPSDANATVSSTGQFHHFHYLHVPQQILNNPITLKFG